MRSWLIAAALTLSLCTLVQGAEPPRRTLAQGQIITEDSCVFIDHSNLHSMTIYRVQRLVPRQFMGMTVQTTEDSWLATGHNLDFDPTTLSGVSKIMYGDGGPKDKFRQVNEYLAKHTLWCVESDTPYVL